MTDKDPTFHMLIPHLLEPVRLKTNINPGAKMRKYEHNK